jgi:hypothetical protein
MKHQTNTVDIRIQKFIDKKLSEFPELQERPELHTRVEQRGYFFKDIIGLISQRATS